MDPNRNRRIMARNKWVSLLGTLALAGCTTEAGWPTGVTRVGAASISQPRFLTVDASAPPLATESVSFWAVRGQTREGEIRYQPRPGAGTGNRLVRLKLDKRSLITRPDGTPIAPGDSLLITLTVVDAARMIVEFAPAGLVFAPNREAQLTFWYLEANHDFNGDGVIDAADASIESGFAIWGQETPADPWQPLASILDPLENEIETEIPGFTRYAVAY